MRRRLWGAIAAALLVGAGVATTEVLTTGTLASAATGPYSRAAISSSPGEQLGGGQYMRFPTVTATGNNAGITITMSGDPTGTWTLTVAPRTGQTLAVGQDLSLQTADTTHMGANLSNTPAGRTCPSGEFGVVNIRSIDVTASALNSVALDFAIRCNNNLLTTPVISGWAAYAMPTGPIGSVTAGEFVPITPFRAYDSRNTSPLAAGEDRTINIGSPVPGDAVAVVLNVTAINPTDWGYLTVYPSGSSRPFASNLNFRPLQTVPNSVIVKLGTSNNLNVFNPSGSTDVAVDVMGYFALDSQAVGGRYLSVNPTRVLDTRSPGGAPFTTGQPRNVAVPVPGAPSNVKSLVLNVTVASAQTGGYLAVYPANQPALTSNLNFVPGDTVPNLVVVGAPQSGTTGTYLVGINVAGTADVVVDLVGVFTDDRTTGAGRFVPITPQRIIDSRTQNIGGVLKPTDIRDLGMVGQLAIYPLEASGVVFNATGASATAATYLTFWPGDQPQPWASNLNLDAGDTRPNLVMMGSDTYGFTNVYNAQGQVDVIADAAGWFTR